LTTINSLVPIIFVKSVPRSIEFYGKWGFEVGNTFTPQGRREPSWAWLKSGGADFMVSLASHPVDASQQAVIFYVYCDDVVTFREALIKQGIEAGEVEYPFYSPRGEFRISDPDGFDINVSHT
jgi:hypothetical protein